MHHKHLHARGSCKEVSRGFHAWRNALFKPCLGSCRTPFLSVRMAPNRPTAYVSRPCWPTPAGTRTAWGGGTDPDPDHPLAALFLAPAVCCLRSSLPLQPTQEMCERFMRGLAALMGRAARRAATLMTLDPKTRRGPIGTSSKYRGVTRRRRTKQWVARIWEERREVYLGNSLVDVTVTVLLQEVTGHPVAL
ncbi:hypothetical protein Agub_g659 [Astrephomene gubernaculifera]|uniref:Uncharacterized protein n=1 Tax=Astrephomene gubernaculifera TaxID=47775 RepID=A0AAD3DE44_9CHLO|nr:hypothetical protein Agub_g659 [Astrephomene gubernaculifera]